MDSKKFNKYKTASDILKSALLLVKKISIEKSSIFEIANISDEFILDKLNSVYKNLDKGLSMPTSISYNKIVSHNNPIKNNDYILKNNDIIRIEMACHIDKCSVTLGDTIKIGDDEFKNKKLMKIARKAVDLSLRFIDEDVDIVKFNSILHSYIKSNNLYLIKRPYVFDESGVSIRYDWCQKDNEKFLEQSWIVRNDNQLELNDSEDDLDDFDLELNYRFNVGNIYHFEIAFSDDNSKSYISDITPTLYQKTNRFYSLKSKFSKQIMSNLKNKKLNYIWSINQLDMPLARIKLGLKECLDHDVIRSLGIIENKGNIVRLKWSVCVRENGPYVLTSPYNIDELNYENISLNPELESLSEIQIKFDNRKSVPKNL